MFISFLLPKPFKQESAIEDAINSIDLIASSLPGITISTFSGLTLESARAIQECLIY